MNRKISPWVGGTLCALLSLASFQAHAKQKDNQFDQFATLNVIFGSGNDNGFFTTDRHKGVELGLRAKTRFPTPMNIFNSDGNGSYTFSLGDACPGFGFSPICVTTPKWNFEWSINTDYDGSTSRKLNGLIYQLGMDSDPSDDTNFTIFDPITPSLVAPGWDHSLGFNGTTSSNDVVDLVSYASNIGTYNVAQNSWNYEFFNNVGTSLAAFNPAVDGNYVIFLRAIDPATNKVVAETMIQVLVGNAQAIKRNKIKLPKVDKGGDDD